MPSHTISVHFRCPLLLFFAVLFVSNLSTLSTPVHSYFRLPSSRYAAALNASNQSLADRLRNLIRRTGAVSCRKTPGDRFHSAVNPRYSCHPVSSPTADFRGLCCFSQRKSHHRESLLPPPPAQKPCHSRQALLAVFLPLNGCFPLNTSPADTKADTSRSRRHPQGSLPLPPPLHFRPQPQHFWPR